MDDFEGEDAVKLEFTQHDQISQYLERLKQNKNKDAMEIVEGIEERELTRRTNLLELFLAERFASKNRDSLNKFDLDK